MNGRRSPLIEELVQRLRSQPMRPDDVTHRRMEARLLDALRREEILIDEEAVSDDETADRASAIVLARRRVISPARVGVAALAVAALAAVGLFTADRLGDDARQKPLTADAAAVDAGLTGSAGRVEWSPGSPAGPVRQPIRPGMRLAPTDGERVTVAMGPAVLRASSGSLVTLDRPATTRRVVSVNRGALDVVFHPKRSRQETLTILTPSARIKVVGTVLRVAVNKAGATAVEVREGRVRVFDLLRDTSSFLGAGEGVMRVAVPRAPAAVDDLETEAPVSVDGLEAESRGPAGGLESQAPAPTDEEHPSQEAPASSPPSELEPSIQSAREPSSELLIGDEAGSSEGDSSELAGSLSPPSLGAWPSSLFGEVDARLVLADRLLQRGLIRRGRHTLYQVVREPAVPADRARAWLRLGQSFEATQDQPNAAEAYRRAIRVDPSSPVAVEAKNELCVMVDDWRCSLW